MELPFRKQAIRNFLKWICFLLVLFLSLRGFSELLVPKTNDQNSGMKNYQARGFYGEPKNTLDIVGIGNSSIRFGFSPMELWYTYGYTGYSCSEPSQTIFEAYNMLTEVMSCQKPKVVVLDTDGVFPTDGRMDTFYKYVYYNICRIIPAVDYHDRWKSLRFADFFQPRSYTWTSPMKGYHYNSAVRPFSGPGRKYSSVVDRISTVDRLQLDAFVRLCRKKKANLLLVYIPTATGWDSRRHELMQQYASKNGLPFLDMNVKTTEYQVDWQDETLDGGIHLNYRGAQKATLYLGKYISQRYLIPDHRKDPAYQRWNADYEKYSDIVQNKILNQEAAPLQKPNKA